METSEARSGRHVIEDLAIVDGLVVSKWGRPVFEAMHEAGMTAANCTCCVWEGFEGTMENIAAFKTYFKDHGDIIRQVYSAEDLRPGADDKRVGVILGFQNSSAIEGNIDYLRLFHELGIRVIQITYNTVNFVGAGCYETTDCGLTDFGREVVATMNKLGILVDLSYVGPKTTWDAILASERPTVFSVSGGTVCSPAQQDG